MQKNMCFETRIMGGLYIMAGHLNYLLSVAAWDAGKEVTDIVNDMSEDGYALKYKVVEQWIGHLLESRAGQDLLLLPSELIHPVFLRNLFNYASCIPVHSAVYNLLYARCSNRLRSLQTDEELGGNPGRDKYPEFFRHVLVCLDRDWDIVAVSGDADNYMHVWGHCFDIVKRPFSNPFNGISLSVVEELYKGEWHNRYGGMVARQVLPAEGLARYVIWSKGQGESDGVLDSSRDNDDAWKMYMTMRGFPSCVPETYRDEVYNMLSRIPGSILNPQNEEMCRNIFYLCVNAAWYYRNADDAGNHVRFADIHLEKGAFDFDDLRNEFGLAEFIFGIYRGLIDRDALLKPMSTDWDNKVFLIYAIRDIVTDEMHAAGLIV